MNSQLILTPDKEAEDYILPNDNWSSKDLANYLSPTNGELLTPECMPEEINIGYEEQDYLDRQNQQIQGMLSTHCTYDYYRSTIYSYSKNNLISNVLAINTLFYQSEQSYAPGGSICDYQPPEPNFLVPILDANNRDNNLVHGQLFISNNISLLVLRTKNTYKIYGNETDPRYARWAKLPGYFTPNDYLDTSKSMNNFLEICENADLSVYFRPKNPQPMYYRTYFRIKRKEQNWV